MSELIYTREGRQEPDLNYALDVPVSQLTIQRDTLEAREFIYTTVNNLLKNNLFICDRDSIKLCFLVPYSYNITAIKTALDLLCQNNNKNYKAKYSIPIGVSDFWNYILRFQDTNGNIEVELVGNSQF